MSAQGRTGSSRAPLAMVGLVLGIGTALGLGRTGGWPVATAAAAVGIGGLALGRPGRWSGRLLRLALLLAAVGWAGRAGPAGVGPPDGSLRWLEGRVSGEARLVEGGALLNVRVTARGLKGRHARGAVRLSLPSSVGEPPPPGSRVRFQGALRPLREFRSPGSSGRVARLHRSGLAGSLRVSGPADWVQLEGPRLLTRWRQAWKRCCRELLDREGIDPAERALLGLLVLGEDHGSSRDLRRRYREAGLAHLLAVSGLHVGVLLGGVVTAARLLGAGRRTRGAVGLVVLGAYWLLVGGRPSISRAALMGTIHLGGWVLGRRSVGLNSLGAAGAVRLLARPGELLQPGFQLTFGATAGILLLGESVLQAIRPLPIPGLRRTLAAGVAAQAAVLPLVARHFQRVAPLGPVAAVAGLIPTTGVVLIGVPAAFLAPLWPEAATLLFRGAGWWGRLLNSLTGTLASTGLGAFLWPAPRWWEMALYGALLILWRHRLRYRSFLVALGLLALVLGQVQRCGPIPSGELEYTALDVGNADAGILRWGRRCLVVDGGGTAFPDDAAARRVLTDALIHQGVRRVDLAVLTHGDADHFGGLLELLQTLPVDRLWITARADLPDPARELLRLARDRNVPVEELLPGLTPSLPKLNPNERSLVLRLSSPGGSLLLPGDLGAPGEARLLDRYGSLKADLLKLGHHGSAGSSTTGFLEAVRPRWAVCSSGRGNTFGHPSPKVLERLAEAAPETRLLRTDQMGAVRVRIGEEGWRVERWVKGRWRRVTPE